MQKLLILVLVLATVALSSSNVLPILSMSELNAEPISYDYQQHGNTFRNNHQTRSKLNAIFFNVDIEPNIEKIPQESYLENKEDFNSVDKDDNYNVKGFRKEQWHNYPRQLDRLNRYVYDHSTDKRNLDPDDPGNIYVDETAESYKTPNQFQIENDLDRKINDEAEVAAAVMNPLLIFRIHLACYNKDRTDNQSPQLEAIGINNEKLHEVNEEENSLSSEISPESNVMKVKREGKIHLEDAGTAHKSSKNRTVNKRIFSLWSRLQSLNPKGHQLHHRRHLYALYGLQDSEGGGGGVLTAETRATFMRPPGSPLRWG